MDPQITKVINRLRSGPYDATALVRIRDELAIARDHVDAKGQRKKLAEVVDLLAAWAKSATEKPVASRALFEAANIAEIDLRTEERAAQLYGMSLEHDPYNQESLERLEPLLIKQKQYRRLETILEAQARTVASATSATPALRTKISRSLGKLRAERTNNADGAIEAYERVLDAEPELADVRALAGLYESRGKSGDRARSADLYFTLGDITEGPDRVVILEKALTLVPTHDGALTALEKCVPPEEGKRLQKLWAAYIDKAPPGPNTDARRRLLAQAYGEEGRFQEALAYIAELVRRRDEAAQKLHVELSTKMTLAAKSKSSGRPSSPVEPEPATISSSPPNKRTLTGYKVPEVANQAPPPAEQAAYAGVPDLPRTSGQAAPPSVPAQSLAHSPQVSNQDLPTQPVSVRDLMILEDEDEALLRKKLPVKWLAAGGAVAAAAVVAALILPSGPDKPAATPEQSTALASAVPPKNPAAASPISAAASAEPTPAKEQLAPPADNKADPTKSAEPGKAEPTAGQAKEAAAGSGAGAEKAIEPSKDTAPITPTEEKKSAAKDEGPTVKVAMVDGSAKYQGGKIDKKLLLKALEQKTLDLERCYTKALAKKPRLKGRLAYAWTVKKNGRVGTIKKIKSTITDKPMNTCVMAAIRKITFPKPKAKAAQIQMAWAFSRAK